MYQKIVRPLIDCFWPFSCFMNAITMGRSWIFPTLLLQLGTAFFPTHCNTENVTHAKVYQCKFYVYSSPNINKKIMYRYDRPCIKLIICFIISVYNAIGCFRCESWNNSHPACDDPFNSTLAYSAGYYEEACLSFMKNREGLYPATACVKISGNIGMRTLELFQGIAFENKCTKLAKVEKVF